MFNATAQWQPHTLCRSPANYPANPGRAVYPYHHIPRRTWLLSVRPTTACLRRLKIDCRFQCATAWASRRGANTAVRACRCTPPSYTLNVRGVAAATNSHGAPKGRTSTVSVATIYQIWSEGCIAHGVTLARSLRRRGKARWVTAAGGGL